MNNTPPIAPPASLISPLKALPEALLTALSHGHQGLSPQIQALALNVLNARSPANMYDAERAIHAAFREVADRIVGTVLQFLVADPRLVEVCRTYWKNIAIAQKEKLQSNGYKETPVQLLGGGSVIVRTLRLARVAPKTPGPKRGRGKRGPAGSGLYPALVQLGITDKATPAVRAEVAREVAEAHSVAVAGESLKQRGLNLHSSTVLRLAYAMSDAALEARRRRFEGHDEKLPPQADKDLYKGRRLLISVDGGRLKVRENPKGGRRRKATGHRRYNTAWREPKVLTIVILDDKGRRDPNFPPLLDATLGNADAVTALLIGHLKAHGGAEAAEVTLVADGAEWIWNRAQTIREEVGIAEERWRETLDFYHAVEHLAEVSKLVKSWTDAERAAWLKQQRRRLKNGYSDLVLQAVNDLRVGRRSKEVNKQLAYFETHKFRLTYKENKEEGRPLGSGAIESGVRRVVNLRMKGNSMFWLEEHAEGILHLRSMLKSGRWDNTVRDSIAIPGWRLAA